MYVLRIIVIITVRYVKTCYTKRIIAILLVSFYNKKHATLTPGSPTGPGTPSGPGNP